ncbi:unnamed protein product [Haemonchus placei]|uniref:Uncharacterized protein n=1 Tax=Haemonchus placei TaxID=6290 RepID=A0A3P7VTV7_HAEPC|nr:unnamed protein product [Haemonchus placei]
MLHRHRTLLTFVSSKAFMYCLHRAGKGGEEGGWGEGRK